MVSEAEKCWQLPGADAVAVGLPVRALDAEGVGAHCAPEVACDAPSAEALPTLGSVHCLQRTWLSEALEL